MIDLPRWMLGFVVIVLIAVLLVACNSTGVSSQTDEPPQVAAGTSKAGLLERLGQPDKMETMVKQQEAIWGPPEAWWHTLEMGDRVEIWSYESSEGTLQLYFLRGSETVDYQAFIDQGVVY